MFLRRLRVRKSGKSHSYWAIVRTVRTPRGPRQQLVSYLGELSATEQREYARIRRMVAESEPVQKELFEPEAGPQWVEVDVKGMLVVSVRPASFEEGELSLLESTMEVLGMRNRAPDSSRSPSGVPWGASPA